MLRAASAFRGNGGSTVQEFRKVKRYKLSAPVLFLWERSDGKLQESQGVTRDISMRGIFVLTAKVPEVGAYIELDAYLPAVSERGKTAKLHAEGRVLRVEALGATTGFAAEAFFQTEPQSVDTILTKIQ
jgi:hypothetical protein